MVYNKIFVHKLVEDLDDVRDYVENGMMIAAVTRLNLIKKDIIKASSVIENNSKIRGKAIPLKKKGNHC